MDSALQAVHAEMLDASIYLYVRATNALDAELEAAEARFTSVRETVGAALDRRRQEMSQQLAEFKQRLGERAHAAEKLAKF